MSEEHNEIPKRPTLPPYEKKQARGRDGPDPAQEFNPSDHKDYPNEY